MMVAPNMHLVFIMTCLSLVMVKVQRQLLLSKMMMKLGLAPLPMLKLATLVRVIPLLASTLTVSLVSLAQILLDLVVAFLLLFLPREAVHLSS
jgi:hypothetical protein